MDTRTGDIYESKEAATTAGVPDAQGEAPAAAAAPEAALATAQAERSEALMECNCAEQQRDAALAERDALKKQACGCVWRPGIEDRDRGDRPFMTCLHHAMLYDRIAEARRVLREANVLLAVAQHYGSKEWLEDVVTLRLQIAAVLAQEDGQ